MSLNLDSLLSSYDVETSPLKLFFWQKEKHTDGKTYPIPIEEPYTDLTKLILGLRIIETDHLTRNIKVLKVSTSFPYNFFSIVDELETIFYHLTNSRIKLEIIPKSSRSLWERLDRRPLNRNIALFSGGLDSLCGALSLSKTHEILAHCITNQVILNKVLRLSSSPPLQRTLLYCFDARTRAIEGGVSETRGLLFLTFSYSIAASLGIRTLNFFENGSQMLDVMLGSLVYPNKWATKNTNLIYIKKIENLFSNFDSKDFRIMFPFQNFTKAEILTVFKDDIKLKDSHSCFTTQGKSLMCGTCWNCFIRRMSLSALGIKEDSAYEINPLQYQNHVSSRTRILFHLLRFYKDVLIEEPQAINEIEISARTYFSNPVILATRFAKDIFLGIMKSFETCSESGLTALGKKAKELLDQIDKKTLLDREEELFKAS